MSLANIPPALVNEYQTALATALAAEPTQYPQSDALAHEAQQKRAKLVALKAMAAKRVATITSGPTLAAVAELTVLSYFVAHGDLP